MFLRSTLKTRWGYAYGIGLLLIGMASSPDEGFTEPNVRRDWTESGVTINCRLVSAWRLADISRNIKGPE